MARNLTGTVAVLLVLAGGASGQDEEGVPAYRLPVLGTVGDLPPEAERVVAHLRPTKPGGPPVLSVDGQAMDLEGFIDLLRRRSEGMREEEAPRLSRLHAVLRVDRDTRWQDAQWLLQACARPEAGVHRVLFAARPEGGGEEGAMALFLPRDGGLPVGRGVRSRTDISLPVHMSHGKTSPHDPGPALFATLEARFAGKRGEVESVRIDAASEVAAGAVLQAADAALRWGVKGVVFGGTSLNKVEGGAGPPPSEVVARPRVLLGDMVASIPEGAVLPPAPPRVVGALAGQCVAPTLPVQETVITEEPPFEGTAGGIGVQGGMFGGRRPRTHRDLAAEGGEGTQAAVEAGLEWLRVHQSPDGHWDADGFETMCRESKCGGAGQSEFDTGATALALLAYIAHGETHKTPRYGSVVRNALKYLKQSQDAEGCFGPRTNAHFTYNHALAALAMAEVYALTQSPLFKSSAQNGANFVALCQNPGMGWRYGVKPRDNDTSATTWMVAALASARAAGLEVDPACFTGATAWLEKVTDPEYGRAGYTARGNGPSRYRPLNEKFPANLSESLTAMALFARNRMGAAADDPMVRKGTALCLNCLPRWDEQAGSIDFNYWHFGTLAMFQVGGDAWRKWNGALREALLGRQRGLDEGEVRGSWDPVDPWAREGGRVYSTAINTLTLETYYRYARAWGGK